MLRMALEARSNAVQVHDRVMETRAWKLFCLLPYLLLRRPLGEQRVSKAELNSRFDDCAEGRLNALLRQMMTNVQESLGRSTAMNPETRAKTACQRVRMGEVSRARQCLTGAALAPGTRETLAELQNTRSQEVLRPVPEEVLNCTPEQPVKLDRQKFFESLKSAPRGSSPGPAGCTYVSI